MLIIMGWWWSCQFYLKEQESSGYRIFDVEFQLHSAALSGELLLPCSLPFFQSSLFRNWPVIERKQSYSILFQVNAWVEARSKNNFLACTTTNDLINELQIIGAGKQSHTHHDWMVSRTSASCSCGLLGGLWWPIPFTLFEENRSKWVLDDGVYVVEGSAAGKVELKRARKKDKIWTSHSRQVLGSIP